MGLRMLIGRLMVRAAKFAGIPLRDPALVAMFGGGETAAGVDVDERNALNISAVWAANRLLSESVAQLPCVPFREKDGDRQEQVDHPVHALLTEQPNPEMTPFSFFETGQSHLGTWGNSYSEIVRDGSGSEAPVVELWPLAPDRVTPDRTDAASGHKLVYRVSPDNEIDGETEEVTLQPHQVLHVPGLAFDGIKGYSPVHMARESLGLATAAERFGAAFFGNGARPGGFLVHPGDLSEAAKKTLREQWEAIHKGPGNAHRIAVLDEDMKWIERSMSMEDAQFLTTRQFQVVEIARWWNVPPHMIKDLSQAHFNNVEHLSLEFLIYSLGPWLDKWAQEIRRKLFTRAERRSGLRVEHKVHHLLRADVKTRYEAYRVGREAGLLTVNDMRKLEGLSRVAEDEADKLLVPLNMRVMGRTQERAAQDEALGGQQISALLAVAQAVFSNTVAKDQALGLIRAALPGADERQIRAIIGVDR